jgi:D-alanine-D-alanine ligase
MNIIVLAGGLSPEREVSLMTGNTVSQALRERGHKVILLDVFLGYGDVGIQLDGIFDKSETVSATVSEIAEQAPDLAAIKAKRKDESASLFGPNVISLCQGAEIVFMALHGEDGENGKIQAAFDLYGIKYTGCGYLSSALAMDKKLAKILFNRVGVPTPEGLTMKRNERINNIEDTGLTLPYVVKPNSGGSSIGVSVVHNQKEYEQALTDAFYYNEEVLIEEFIQGREFAVGIIAGDALPVIEIAPIKGFYDYKNKYQCGGAVETCPATLPKYITEEMQHYAKKAAEALEITTYARMDFLLNNQGNLFCLEANTLPGMTPTSLLPQEAKAAGLNFGDLCEKLVAVSFQKYQ